MYVWSKRLVIGLLSAFTILLVLFFFEIPPRRPQYFEDAYHPVDHPELYRTDNLGRRLDVRSGARAWEKSCHVDRAISLRAAARVDVVCPSHATAHQRIIRMLKKAPSGVLRIGKILNVPQRVRLRFFLTCGLAG